MECRRYTDSLTAYIDAELSEKETEKVQAHLNDCPDCAREHRSLLYAHELTNQLAPVVASSTIWKAIETELKIHPIPSRRETGILPFLRRRWIPVTALSGALAASIVLFSVVPSGSPLGSEFSSFLERRERVSHRNQQLFLSAPAYDRHQLGRNPFMQFVGQTNQNPFQE